MPLPLTLTLVATKVVLLVLVVTLSFGLAPGFDGGASEARTEQAAAAAQARALGDLPVERAIERHDCSVLGYDDERPASALVARGERLRHVPFGEGWLVGTGQAPGRLVAVCRAEV